MTVNSWRGPPEEVPKLFSGATTMTRLDTSSLYSSNYHNIITQISQEPPQSVLNSVVLKAFLALSELGEAFWQSWLAELTYFAFGRVCLEATALGETIFSINPFWLVICDYSTQLKTLLIPTFSWWLFFLFYGNNGRFVPQKLPWDPFFFAINNNLEKLPLSKFFRNVENASDPLDKVNPIDNILPHSRLTIKNKRS